MSIGEDAGSRETRPRKCALSRSRRAKDGTSARFSPTLEIPVPRASNHQAGLFCSGHRKRQHEVAARGAPGSKLVPPISRRVVLSPEANSGITLSSRGRRPQSSWLIDEPVQGTGEYKHVNQVGMACRDRRHWRSRRRPSPWRAAHPPSQEGRRRPHHLRHPRPGQRRLLVGGQERRRRPARRRWAPRSTTTRRRPSTWCRWRT